MASLKRVKIETKVVDKSPVMPSAQREPGPPYLTVIDAERIVRFWDENVRFDFYSVKFFNPQCSFSRFSTIAVKQPVGTSVGNLYDIDIHKLTGRSIFFNQEKKNILEMFLGQLKCIGVSEAVVSKKEKDCFFAIAKEILSKLGNEVMLSHDTYRTMVDKDHSLPKNVQVKNLGLGTLKTLHGYPDARVRAISMETEFLSMDPGDSGTASSLGDSCVVEGKTSEKTFNIDQLISIAVTSSFTEQNLHKHLSSMTPTIMLGPCNLQICLYDCVLDVLMISNSIEWMIKDENGCHIVDTGLILLWMTIHHRYFLKVLNIAVTQLPQYSSTLRDKLKLMGVLDEFEKLRGKNSVFLFSPKGEALSQFCEIDTSPPPPLRKRRTI